MWCITTCSRCSSASSLTSSRRSGGSASPAPRAILSAAVEGAQVDVETASRIESRYLTNLIVNQQSKNMIQAFFFDLQHISGGGSRPEGYDKYTAKKVGVIGAGMMGAAIAYVSAKAGIEVVLKDIDLDAAKRGKGYSEKLEEKALAKGRTTAEKSAELLARIRLRLREHEATEDPGILEHAGMRLDIRTRRVEVDGRIQELTNREYSLLEMLLRNKGETISREQLLESVWGMDFDPGSNIVNVYIRSLRRKIGDDRRDRPRHIVTVRGVGFRFDP